MPVYSHSKPNDDGKKEGSKLLTDHLKGVRDKSLKNYSDRVTFSNAENYKLLLENVCWLHDLGKYTGYFQTYLLNSGKVEQRLKNHSSLGAHTAFNLLKKTPQNALFAYYLIKLHHSNLLNFDQVLWPDHYNGSKWKIQDTFQKQIQNLTKFEDLKKYYPEFDDKCINFVEPKELFDLFKIEIEENTSIENYFLLNYLFSLLIESDKLDATDTIPYKLTSLSENAVDSRFGNPSYPKRDLIKLSQNQLRNFVRSEVIMNLQDKDILQKKIFTLAAPTGIGKTMTALDFSLKLRKKVEFEEGYLSQIIYGLPFINIIEQALSEYEKTLKDGEVLGHYQFADIFGKDEPNKNLITDQEHSYSQKKMAWDTWQSDVVITSFVQLFETLIGNRNKLLKKFHHFADSIIILDEVQTLSIEKLPLIGAALFYLAKFLNSRIIIMTATQPKIFELMDRELNISIDDPNFIPENLLKRDHEVFACFNRTKIIPKINSEIDIDGFSEIFDSNWSPDKSCLIVVNKVNRSIELYNKICELKRKKEFKNPILYLSTNITPIERRKRVNWLKYKLRNGAKPILISTQVVEAGVDLDFDMGFRDLGPIDSIVQVAGRINRENAEERKGSPLYVVDLGDCQPIYGVMTDIQARFVLDKAEIPESEYKILVERYFDEIADQKRADFSKSKNIFDAMEYLRYAHPGKNNSNKQTVSDFKIIEDSQNGISVFVELLNDQIGTKARKAFQDLLNDDIPRHEFESKYKRAFHQRIIAVPDYLQNVKDLEKEERLTEDILWIKPDLSEYYYDKDAGFIRKDEKGSLVMF